MRRMPGRSAYSWVIERRPVGPKQLRGRDMSGGSSGQVTSKRLSPVQGFRSCSILAQTNEEVLLASRQFALRPDRVLLHRPVGLARGSRTCLAERGLTSGPRLLCCLRCFRIPASSHAVSARIGERRGSGASRGRWPSCSGDVVRQSALAMISDGSLR